MIRAQALQVPGRPSVSQSAHTSVWPGICITNRESCLHGSNVSREYCHTPDLDPAFWATATTILVSSVDHQALLILIVCSLRE